MSLISKPINKVLEQHKLEWKTYCNKVKDKQLKLNWLQIKRSEYLMHDDTVSVHDSRDSFFGMGCDLNKAKPKIVFIVKSPRSKDKDTGFTDETWSPLIGRIATGNELKDSNRESFQHRSMYLCLYYFPRRLFVKKYRPHKEQTEEKGGVVKENHEDEEEEEEEDKPELTSKHIDVYGWYVIQILKLLNPPIIVPIGSYVTRVTLQCFHSNMDSTDVVNTRDAFGTEVKIRGLWMSNADKSKYDSKVNIPFVSVVPLIDPCQTSLISFCNGDKDELWELCWGVIGKVIGSIGNKRYRNVSEKSLMKAMKEMEPVKKAKLTDQPCHAERYTFGRRVTSSEQKARNIQGPMDSYFKVVKKKSAKNFVF